MATFHNKHIAPLDERGVALAAIQGLDPKLEVRGQRSQAGTNKLETENAELKQSLEKLEQLMNQNNRGAQ